MNEHDDETDAYAMTDRRIATAIAAQRWHPCVACDGTGYAQNAPFVPKHALTSSECPACQGTGTTKPAPFADAYPVRFGGHAGWLTLCHPDYPDDPIVVDAHTGEVYQAARFETMMVLEEIADVTDYQADDDILHRARRAGYRVRLAERL